MSNASENLERTGGAAALEVRAEAAEMFVEVQRADAKGTALCGVAGGLLALDTAVLPSASERSGPAVAFLVCAAVLLGAALVAAISAVRPVLPRGGGLRVFICAGAGASAQHEEVLPGVRLVDADEQLGVEAERLMLFTWLASRKFRAIRWAADFTSAAMPMAGIGLLSMYIPA
ncbi:Pycsar system effector family protein [Streptomyces sp. NPDC054796]